MKKIIKCFFSLFGIEIKRIPKIKRIDKNLKKSVAEDIDAHLKHDMNHLAYNQIKTVRNYTMLPYINLLTLYDQVVYCEKNNIKGDFVECGVWKGGSSGLMALANLEHGKQKRHIHLFDVFNDICEPDPKKDGEDIIEDIKKLTGDKGIKVTGRLEPIKGVYDSFGGPGTLEVNKDLFEKVVKYESSYIHYHKGWFQDTVPKECDEIKEIAILRLDGDYYDSTKICLDHLYDKVVKNGFIIIDDYGTYIGCRNAVNDFFKERGLNYYLNYSNYDCRYIIKH